EIRPISSSWTSCTGGRSGGQRRCKVARVTCGVGIPVIDQIAVVNVLRHARNFARNLQSAARMDHYSRSQELNLQIHRAGESVWDRRGWNGTPEQLTMTRWLLGLGGIALAVQGLRQRSITGSLLAAVGGSLGWWALTGEGDLSDAQRWFRLALERAGWGH